MFSSEPKQHYACRVSFLLAGYKKACCRSDDRLAPEDGTCIFSARINGPLLLLAAHIRDDGPQVWRGLPGVKLSIRPPILHPSPDKLSCDEHDAVYISSSRTTYDTLKRNTAYASLFLCPRRNTFPGLRKN
jgi:hypothetical protein